MSGKLWSVQTDEAPEGAAGFIKEEISWHGILSFFFFRCLTKCLKAVFPWSSLRCSYQPVIHSPLADQGWYQLLMFLVVLAA